MVLSDIVGVGWVWEVRLTRYRDVLAYDEGVLVANSSSSAFASCKSLVSNPSVNQL